MKTSMIVLLMILPAGLWLQNQERSLGESQASPLIPVASAQDWRTIETGVDAKQREIDAITNEIDKLL